ncbi:tubulin-folding cofactor B [Mytilus galloprovincialis]|uniref:Tubulin-folding cofactor B n=1 Tax=Mytilus galloprovincialis TaxID=29158 RepID=A0A8B6E569_MYTGA|nr:tubulin-folding cofactor B [Mytilus galloprovincialis]
MSEFSVITQSIVTINVTSSANSFGTERRFQKDLSVADLKNKLELLTGSQSANMKLELYSKDNKLLSKIDNDEVMFGSYPVDDGCRLHVVDSTIKLGEFEDLSKVEKFEMKEDDYAKRTDSVRAFKERNKMGRFAETDPEELKRKEEEKKEKELQQKTKAEAMKVGDSDELDICMAGILTVCADVFRVIDESTSFSVFQLAKEARTQHPKIFLEIIDYELCYLLIQYHLESNHLYDAID